MSMVYIVVEDGLVQNVYADVGGLEIEVIDLDANDLQERQYALDRLEDVRAISYLRY